jgi:hypothetical protein
VHTRTGWFHGTCIVLLVLVSCQRTEPRSGVIEGQVMGSEPVAGATVEVWRIDGQGAPAGTPSYTAETDAAGRYRIEVHLLAPPFLVTARGGTTREYWTGETISLDADRASLRAVVDHAWLRVPRDVAPIAVSPLTTVAAALAEQRLAEGLETGYDAAVTQAHALLDGHFDIDMRTALPGEPGDGMDTAVDAGVRHALALAGMSALVHELAIATGRSIDSMNIFMLTDALVADARGPGARLDGTGPAGAISLGSCGEACPLPADALRRALAVALVRDWLPSPGNRLGLDFGDVAELVQRISDSRERGLFGDVPADELDGVPASLALGPSIVLDETRDRIVSESMLPPGHEHDVTAVIDLGQGLGDTCPVVYKHADLLRATMDSNPLRWRFVARDDLVGVRAMDIAATLRTPAGAEAPLVISTEAVQLGREVMFEVEASGATVPALVTTEGKYEIEVRARDALGNESAPLTACWQHELLGAPLWGGSFELAIGPGSFDDARLESDNLAPVIRGDETPVVASFPVENNTDADVYLTLSIDELTGRYSATWISSRALLRVDSEQDDCLAQQTCSEDEPATDTEFLGPATIPASAVSVRVVEQVSGREATCDDCDPNEFRIAARARYQVQVIVADLGFLLAPGVQRNTIAEIAVGPIGTAARLTGVDGGIYVYCSSPLMAVCRGHQIFQLYRALTAAAIEIDRVTISAQTSALPADLPRTPQPPVDAARQLTLSEPISTGFIWITEDAALPD